MPVPDPGDLDTPSDDLGWEAFLRHRRLALGSGRAETPTRSGPLGIGISAVDLFTDIGDADPGPVIIY